MSDTETEGASTSGVKIPRFHGRRDDDYNLWRHRLRAACRIKNVWSVVNTGTSDSSASATTETDAATPTPSSRTAAKREMACGIIISALGDAPLRVVMDVDDDPGKMLDLLDARYASNRTVSRIAVQTQLFRMSYSGQDMASYVDQYTSLFSQLERMGKDAAIPESHKAPMLLASIDPNCFLESTAAALRTKESSELTWEYVATTLIDEYNAKRSSGALGSSSSRHRWKSKGRRKKSKAFVSDMKGDSDSSDVESTARALAAALHTANKSRPLECDFCNRRGHTKDRCFVNPDNPDNHLPKQLLEKLSASSVHANAAMQNKKKAGGSEKFEIAGMSIADNESSGPDLCPTFLDSGASAHCFQSSVQFVPGSLTSCAPRVIALADKSTVVANQVGEVLLSFENANLRLTDVLLVPEMGYNLVSCGRLADKGIESRFSSESVSLILVEKEFLIGSGCRQERNGMYVLPSPDVQGLPSVNALVASADSESILWHLRLAHMNFRDLQDAHKYAEGVPELKNTDEICRACSLGKAHKLPFHGHFEQCNSPGEIVHSDVVGKLEPSYPDGYRYFATFMDGHSRYLFVAFMVNRSDLYDSFDAVSTMFQKLGGVPIKSLHSDGAKEYVRLQQEVSSNGVNVSFSAPYTPEHNAIAERVNRTLVEAARTLLIQANLPGCLWPFALKQVVYVRNRVRHSAVGNTPFFLFSNKTPSLKGIRVFGCTAFVLRQPRASKFEPRAYEGVYLESLGHGVYKVLVIDDDGTPRLVVSRHVKFDENRFIGAPTLQSYMDDDDGFDPDVEIDDETISSTSSDVFELDDVEESISKPLSSDIPTVDDSDHNNVGEW